MSFIYTNPGRVSTLNSFTFVDGPDWCILCGACASAGSSNTVHLSGGSAVDNFYNGKVVEMRTGGARNNGFVISSYVGATKMATVSGLFAASPAIGDRFIVHRICGTITSATPTTATLANVPLYDNLFNGCVIAVFTTQEGALTPCQMRIVSSFSSTGIATVSNWSTAPSSGAVPFAIFGVTHTTLASPAPSTTSFSFTARFDVTINFYAGCFAALEDGSCATILTSTAAASGATCTIVTTVDGWRYGIIPSVDQLVNIHAGFCGQLETSTDISEVASTIQLDDAWQRAFLIMRNASLSHYGFVTDAATYIIDTPLSESHVIVNQMAYFEVRAICTGEHLTGILQTVMHQQKSASPITSLQSEIISSTDVINTRSILVGQTGNGTFRAVQTDNGNLKVRLSYPLTAFGQMSCALDQPTSEVIGVYGINTQNVETFTSPAFKVNVFTAGAVGVAQVQYIKLGTFQSVTNGVTTGEGRYFELYTTTSTATAHPRVWYQAGTNTAPPAIGGGSLVSVTITAGMTSSQVTTATITAINTAAIGFSAANFFGTGNLMQLTNTVTGVSRSAEPGTMLNTAQGSTITAWQAGQAAAFNAMISLQADDGAGDYAVVRSRRGIRYHPGQGAVARFTASFSAPNAYISQFAGVGNATSSLFFGYDHDPARANSMSFGILRIIDAAPTARRLTITVAAGVGGQTIFLMLDGVTVSIPGPSSAGNPSVATTEGTAAFLANYLTAVVLAPLSWRCFSVSNTVIFTSESGGTRSLSYSLTVAAGGSIAGTFDTLKAGGSGSYRFTPQSQWSIDPCNGTGESGINIRPEFGNVFAITWQWLGFGAINFFIENPKTGSFILAHTEEISNSQSTPSLLIPGMQLTWATVRINVDASAATALKLGSGGTFIQGSDNELGSRFSALANVDSVPATEQTILSIQGMNAFNGLSNQAEAHIQYLSVANDGTKPAIIYVRFNPTTTRAVWNYVMQNQSFISSAVYSATNAFTIDTNTGSLLLTLAVPSGGGETFDLASSGLLLRRSEILSISAQATSGTTNLVVALSWIEDQ